MVTGYTCIIEEGASFESFVLHCAKAFDIRTRDSNNSYSLLELIEPDPYYLNSYSQLLLDLEDMQKNKEKALIELKKELESDSEYYKEQNSQKRALRAKYETMLKKVNDWTPPTQQHLALKEFMVNQITESIEFDCKEVVVPPPKKITKRALESAYKARIENIKKDIKHYKKKYDDEVESTKQANGWVRDLLGSLQIPLEVFQKKR